MAQEARTPKLWLILVLVIVFALANIQSEHSQSTGNNCTSCDADTVNQLGEILARFAKGIEPIQLLDQTICKKVIITGLSTISGSDGKACVGIDNMTSNAWQEVGLRVKNIHVECEIIAIEDFAQIVGINIPLPPLPIISILNPQQLVETSAILVDVPEFILNLVTHINFEEDLVNVTRLDLNTQIFDSMQISLSGNSLFTKLGEIITKPKPVRSALGYVIKIVLRKLLLSLLNGPGPGVKEIISLINCGETDY